MTDEVPVWNMGRIRSFHPQMTMRVEAPAQVTLDVLAAAVRGARFRVRGRHETGFRARYLDWFSLAGANINWTTLEVTCTSRPSGTEVLVTGGYEGTDLHGRKRASQGLSSAVAELRRRGIEVSTTPWAAREEAQQVEE